jgi:Ca2+-binding EF-hand superfamily protein
MKKLSMFFGFAGLTALSAIAFADEAKTHEREHGAHHGHKGGMMSRADANKDGKVTLAEALAAGMAHFDKKDANRDGAITKDEVKGRGERMLERADANKDGKVTRAEGEALVREGFTRFDKNKDGVISKDDLPQHRQHAKPRA